MRLSLSIVLPVLLTACAPAEGPEARVAMAGTNAWVLPDDTGTLELDIGAVAIRRVTAGGWITLSDDIGPTEIGNESELEGREVIRVGALSGAYDTIAIEVLDAWLNGPGGGPVLLEDGDWQRPLNLCIPDVGVGNVLFKVDLNDELTETDEGWVLSHPIEVEATPPCPDKGDVDTQL